MQAGEIATLLSLKVTVPVGEPLAAETVAVKVTGSVGADGFIDETSAVKQGTKTEMTDASGVYRFPALEVGTYSVSADLSGFKKELFENIAISAGRELAIDLVMKLGGVSEAITVTGATPVVDVKSSATALSKGGNACLISVIPALNSTHLAPYQ